MGCATEDIDVSPGVSGKVAPGGGMFMFVLSAFSNFFREAWVLGSGMLVTLRFGLLFFGILFWCGWGIGVVI